MNIELYLYRLALRLRGLGPLAGRPLAEMRDHLVSSTEELVKEGMSRGEAETEAVRRMGDSDLVADQLIVTVGRDHDWLGGRCGL